MSNRRHLIDMQTPVERKIMQAIAMIETMGADSRLTNAQRRLDEAFGLIADFTDEQGVPIAAADKDASPGAKFLPGFISITDEKNGTFTPPVANLNGKSEPVTIDASKFVVTDATAAPNVVELGPHSKMTPEQALAYCSREQWDDVVIIGYHKDAKSLSTRSSHMSRECALWLAEHFKLGVLNLS